MTERDLQLIESEIGRPLSLAYRRFMLNPPSELRASIELLCQPEPIVDLNQSGATAGWPSNQLALGDNGCGDVYSIDLDDEGGAVYLSGPHSGFETPDEDGYFEKVFGRLHDFAQHLLRMQEGS